MLTFRVVVVSAAETDRERSAEDRVPALLEKRPTGWMLVIVEALLLKDGTSSTDMRSSCPGSPLKREFNVRRSVKDEDGVASRGPSNEEFVKPGDESVEEMVCGVAGCSSEADHTKSMGADAGRCIRGP